MADPYIPIAQDFNDGTGPNTVLAILTDIKFIWDGNVNQFYMFNDNFSGAPPGVEWRSTLYRGGSMIENAPQVNAGLPFGTTTYFTDDGIIDVNQDLADRGDRLETTVGMSLVPMTGPAVNFIFQFQVIRLLGDVFVSGAYRARTF